MSPASARRSAAVLTGALLVLLPFLPPEIHGLSAAACGALLALGGILFLRARAPLASVLLLLAAAWPLSIVSQAPGATPGAFALPLLALAAGAIGGAASPSAGRVVPPVLGAVGAMAGVHALWQLAFGLEAAAGAIDPAATADPALALALTRLREGRAFAGFATPAALGCFLALALPVTLAAAFAARGRRRLAFSAAAGLQVAGLAATQSATAVGALAAAGALFALRRAASRRLVLLGLALLAALLLAILVARRDRLLDPDEAQGSWRLRAGNAAAALRMIEARPWLGAGPGTFAEVYPSVFRPGGNEVRHAHDLPLELAAEIGIPLGLLAAAAFAFVFLGPLLRASRQASPWAQGASVGLAAFAIQNLADFTAFFPALLWSACLLRGAAGEGAGEGTPVPAPPSWARAVAAAALVLAAAVAAGAGLSADTRRAAAEALRSGDIGRASILARRAAAMAPWEPDAHLLRGAVLYRAGEPAPALEETERAIALSPVRPAAHAQRARLRAARGDFPGAFADLARASELYPARAAYARDAEALRRQLARAYAARP